MTSNPAPKNIYQMCNEIYSHHGQYGVFEYVGKFSNIKWTWCEPCESTTPFDPYSDRINFDTQEEVVTCLVCGTENENISYEAVIVVVYEQDGDKCITHFKQEEATKWIQKEVGGYFEVKPLPSLGVTLWFNEEARIKPLGLSPNFLATKLWHEEFGDTDDTVLLGNVVITSHEEDEHGYPCSLKEDKIKLLMERE